MKKKRIRKISRRDALKFGGMALVAAVLSCNRQRGIENLSVQPTLMNTVPAYSTPPARTPPMGPSDLLLRNGKVYTVDSANSRAQAVAIKDGLIQAVGTDEAIGALAGSETKVIDLGGKVVTPGFIDPHIHVRAQGLFTSYYTPFMPPDVKDTQSLQRALAEVIKSKQPGDWVMGYYIGLKDKPVPTKEDFDPVSPNNPVFIMHIGGHWATANSAAMQIAKITDSTPSPDGGIIEKKDGKLTGVFYNHRAMDVLRVYAPPITTDEVRKGILESQTLLAACGITSFQDNNVRDLDDIKTYQDLSAEGKLYLRNDLYLTLEWPADLSKLDQVRHIRDDITRFAGFKFLIDGQGPTSYCHEAHNGVEWRMPTWDPAIYKDTIRTLHDTGLQICVHCVGDAATDLTLEAYEAAMNANPRSDPRHRIEHAVLTTPQATTKMKDLGVVVSAQPGFVYLVGDSWEPLYGAKRMDRMMVVREWLEAGVHVAFGSDAPSVPFYNPQFTLASAMSRLTLKLQTLGPEHKVTFDEALRAHTFEGAYAAHEENLKGSLEPGKFADIVVWPKDPTAMTLAELVKATTVDMTLVGGKTVYQAG